MTREEAIEAIKCNWPDSRYTILREALDMAISALREQKGKDTYVPTNADRIRAMRDEDLAKFLDTCESMGYEDSSIATDSSGHCMDMLEWLKQPPKGE